MPTRTLPPRPDLAQLKRQANELLKLQREKKASVIARIAATHPRFKQHPPERAFASPFALADAQLVIAREYGYPSWASLKHDVEATRRVAPFTQHPRFAEAVGAIVAGDLQRLRVLLDAHPELVRARTNLEPPFHYFTGATLLHHLAWNPSREEPVPPNVVDIARLLLDRGADPDALTLGRSIGTTMGLIVTSRMASEANSSGPLIDLLRDRGAKLDLGNSETVIPDWGKRNVLHVALSNYGIRAAQKLIELGAKPDICSAAALGRMDLVRGFFDSNGELTSRPRRDGAPMPARDAIGLALLFAYVNHHPDVVDFLLEKDGNWNMTGVNNGAAMHRAAWSGDLTMVQRLVARGADFTNRDNPFNSTPLSWAQHNKQQAVFDWLRAQCAIDIHDAASFDLREHVEARLHEDPASIDKRLDQWEAPQCTPLYWAAWTRLSDVDGAHELDESKRIGLVRLLLDHGADPNIIAGDGNAPLDVALGAGAANIAALIESRGGRRAADL
ncbi:MAG TPA: ankyrin repeat domain-containing protein [Gemmatimonadaceae bacterium]|jgi:ankyrin repeat protein